MRVLHVDTAREWRGGQVQLRSLVTRAAGEHVVVAREGAPLHRELVSQGVEVHPVALGRWRGTLALAAACRRVQPDLVAVHTSHAHVHADRLGWPVVLHRRLDFVPSWAGRRRARRARGVVAVSAAVAAVLRSAAVPAGHISVVPDGVEVEPADGEDPRAELGLPASTPLVVAVGALVTHKGHRVLVDALPSLPGVHAVVVGSGPLRAELEARAQQLGISRRLHLVGQRSDPARWQTWADVVCHPSLEEGLGQAVVEALLQGAAVVASRAGGLPELVCDAGLLATPDDPRALSRALVRGLAQRDALRHAARLRRGWLQHRYGVESMVEGTLAAYARFSVG